MSDEKLQAAVAEALPLLDLIKQGMLTVCAAHPDPWWVRRVASDAHVLEDVVSTLRDAVAKQDS